MENIDMKLACKLVAMATEKAQKDFQRPICVAICDTSGFLTAYARMEGSPLRSIEICQRKAYTAVRMGVNTDAFLERLRNDNIPAGYFGDDRFTALPGGNVLKNAEGRMIGGIGVSGLASSEDKQITDALAAFVAGA
ncbi:MAG: heme-binding protein [Negativicutes bacterium]|nr:heme-binding protein [Negativicutes bacterium]